jgi:GT2 family glycosyltransferase
MVNVAVLLTCYNRVKTTLECLSCFYRSNKPPNTHFDIFLLDDNSPDRTGEIIKKTYPEIHVFYGTGNLYWNGGMRFIWKIAAKSGVYDFYLLFNDDIIL